jgi:precorrin-2 dehydrogenase/sirohydrochlorin ferrochelatase
MRYYPLQVDIEGRSCLVVGGGQVGTRKVERLLACRARIRVVSPEATPALERLVRQGRLDLQRREYRPGDTAAMFLVFAATDSREVNRRVAEEAAAAGILFNSVDDPERAGFIVPSVVHRKDLVITVSTTGKSPALARHLRKRLEKQFGNEYAELLVLMGRYANGCWKRGVTPPLIGNGSAGWCPLRCRS